MKEPFPARCPVPLEQQPLNEYEQLRDAWLYTWVTLERPVYVRKLLWVWIWGWLVAAPVTAVSFAPDRAPVRFLLAASGGAGILVILVLVRLYSGWYYVKNRLNRAEVDYEESGWYDGQVWQKSAEELTRDRLVVDYQLTPIFQRLRGTFLFLTLAIALGTTIWLLWL